MEALTLQQAKDEIAKRKGYDSFNKMVWPNGTCSEEIADEAAELYCQSQKAKAWEEGFENGNWKPFTGTAKPVNPYLSFSL